MDVHAFRLKHDTRWAYRDGLDWKTRARYICEAKQTHSSEIGTLLHPIRWGVVLLMRINEWFGRGRLIETVEISLAAIRENSLQ